MGKTKTFQVCYEGELNLELADSIRRLGGEPNFENSWHLNLSDRRHAMVLLRYLRPALPPDGRLFVARTHLSRSRDFLLIRHGLVSGADYTPLVEAISELGYVIDISFESTYIVQTSLDCDVQAIGESLVGFCADESLMIVGISHDFAAWGRGAGQMLIPHEDLGGERPSVKRF